MDRLKLNNAAREPRSAESGFQHCKIDINSIYTKEECILKHSPLDTRNVKVLAIAKTLDTIFYGNIQLQHSSSPMGKLLRL
jgi:hypothetical protein